MGLDVGDYHDRPSLLIATCPILAVRTAKWRPRSGNPLSEGDLEIEIDFPAHTANRVSRQAHDQVRGDLPPQRKEAWYRRTMRTCESDQFQSLVIPHFLLSISTETCKKSKA